MPDATLADAVTPTPDLAARAVQTGSSPVRDILALTARPEVISFAGGLPAPELFDATGIAAAFQHVLTEEPRRALQYSTSEGSPELRAAVAARTTARGLATDADDLIVTTGSQQGLSLLATALLEPGDVVLVEDPCYLAALQIFSFAGARVVPVPTDDEGLLPERAGRDRRAGAAQAALRRADLPEPDGTDAVRRAPGRGRGGRRPPRAVDRRGRPVRRAALRGRAGAVGRRLPRRGGPYGAARVVLQGDGARACGWAGCVRRPPCGAPASSPSRPPTCTPRPSTRQPRRGTWRSRTWTRIWSGCAAPIASGATRWSNGLAVALPEGSRWNRPAGGMFVWATLPEGYDATALLPEVVRHDVAYVPGAPFFAGPPDATAVRLSFVTHSPDEIREGLVRLATALGSAHGARTRRGEGRER